MPRLQGQDKMPLQSYLEDITGQVLSAIASVEKRHEGWEFGATSITVRVVLKPVKEGGKTMVYADIDEGPNVQVSEIPLLIRRKDAP